MWSFVAKIGIDMDQLRIYIFQINETYYISIVTNLYLYLRSPKQNTDKKIIRVFSYPCLHKSQNHSFKAARPLVVHLRAGHPLAAHPPVARHHPVDQDCLADRRRPAGRDYQVGRRRVERQIPA